MLQKIITRAVVILAFFLAFFHLYAGGIQIFPSMQQRGVHLGFALALIFLIYPFMKKQNNEGNISTRGKIAWVTDILLAGASIFIAGYIYMHFIDLSMAFSSPTITMLVVGILSILLTLEAARRIIGWALPVLATLFLVYAFVGEKLPLLFAHSGYSLQRIITQVGLSNEGVFGIPLGVSATYVVLFVLFGSFLEKSGAGKFFIDLAFSLVGRFRGGAAKVSIVSSALFGSISGSQVGNVATTGILTIPLMKRGGYKAKYAGAVESVASTGGMLLPPVMGAVAFLMADFLQVEYIQVALAALIPALLYFIAIFIMVDLRAARMGENSEDHYKVPNLKEMIVTKGHLILPLLVLVFLLIGPQLPPPEAAFWGIVSVPLVCLLRKETRMSFYDMKEAIVQGMKLSLVVASACACAGIVIGVINMTGMGLRFSGILIELSGGHLFVLLLLTMVASIIMGMGLPPVASYIILAVLAAPAITQLGVPSMAAHMFIFYYGVLSGITPPVAIAAYAASGIAKTNPMSTSITACRLAAVAFIVPFMFVYGPALIFQGTVVTILLASVTALIGIYALAVALEGYLKQPVLLISRSMLFLGAVLLINVGILFDIIGFVLIVATLLYELKVRKFVGVPNLSAKEM
ncbi:TRAP transporter permease [Halalkalibacter alkaliphilus]|uniref:TRAP transporter permease n=1 Tax=Halalkalibacter alkaliphilus TaxID=2917993 RepID=A0A9X2I942_9BACI|nr:TRAP transporter permease [Halalkalibacter alkaliphilus]MCL7748540.1 TRAP transporter permease [Halalkalibacter alkaliphilus]